MNAAWGKKRGEQIGSLFFFHGLHFTLDNVDGLVYYSSIEGGEWFASSKKRRNNGIYT